MTPVGTVKEDKPESATLFVHGKQSVFFYLSCTSYLPPLPYVPARNRTVILFSWQHHDVMCMGEAQDRNWKLSCIIMTTESGVDVLKKLVTDYTVWDQQGAEIWNSGLKHTQPIAISKHCHSNSALYYFMQEILLLSVSFRNISSFVSLLLKTKRLYQVCKTHAKIWSWPAQTLRV